MHSRRAAVRCMSSSPRAPCACDANRGSPSCILATSARSSSLRPNANCSEHTIKNPSAGQAAGQATHLCNQHAVLELGVGGDLLPQLGVLGHQALAVAAPCGQGRAQRSSRAASTRAQARAQAPRMHHSCAQVSARQWRLAQQQQIDRGHKWAGAAAQQRCGSACQKGAGQTAGGSCAEAHTAAWSGGEGSSAGLEPPSPNCNTLLPLTRRVELQGEGERREAGSEQQAANECGDGRWSPAACLGHARLRGVAHSTHLDQRRPLAIVHGIEVVGCCGAGVASAGVSAKCAASRRQRCGGGVCSGDAALRSTGRACPRRSQFLRLARPRSHPGAAG